MSVTSAQGFIAGVAKANLRTDGSDDLAVVINTGPEFKAAAVFTTNQVKAAPVLWSEQAIKSGTCKAVVLNSGGANACTGPKGFQVAHKTAEHLAHLLSVGSVEIQVCSTGLIGKQLPLANILPAIDEAVVKADLKGGEKAASAILTTDSHPKQVEIKREKFTIGGMIKGAGMLAPDLATMLCVLTTDAVVESSTLQESLQSAVSKTLNRIDSDGCTSTNDSVLLMCSGASGESVDKGEFEDALIELLEGLGEKLIQDAEGSTKDIKISAVNCSNEDMAEAAARAVARNNLFKTAMTGSDPNWGRIMAAIGVIDFKFDQFLLDVYLNGSLVCANGEALEMDSVVDLSERLIEVVIDFKSGGAQASVWTNDLSEKYVYENSAYST
jgi:glutamate N-acetyltransferase / amino-acid N-acetyltransferase